MGHILNPFTEDSPLFDSEVEAKLEAELSNYIAPSADIFRRLNPTDFWDQYFRFQELADAVAERDARVNVDIVNNATGESFHLENIVLKTSDETLVN